MQGNGTCRYPNGDSYDGEWALGLRCGYGTLTYAQGGYYKGDVGALIVRVHAGIGVSCFSPWIQLEQTRL